jgi:hypothetical protein
MDYCQLLIQYIKKQKKGEIRIELVGFLRCREDADHLEGLKDLFNLLAQYSVFPAIEKRKFGGHSGVKSALDSSRRPRSSRAN